MVSTTATTETTRTDGARGVSRRLFLAGLPLALAGCTATARHASQTAAAPQARIDPYYVSMYSAQYDGGFQVPAVDLRKIDPVYYRQQVAYPATEQAGTIVVDPNNRFLYLVRGDGTALRYGIGVGREGFGWSGVATVGDKQAWPTWTPPKEMVERDPKAAPYADGMPGGPENPLGARALYLYEGRKDTLYRIHGTNEPWSIGKAVSSGCIRMLNQDAMDLYNRVPEGTVVVVLGDARGYV